MRAAFPLAAVLLLGACHIDTDDGGNHQNARRDFQVGAFQKIALAGSSDVVVTVGGAPSVRAEGDKAVIDRLDIRVENGELKIENKRHDGWNWDFGGSHHNHVTVYVTAPSLAGVSVAGSGDMKVDKVAGSEFDASLAGSGDLNVDSLQVAAARFNIAGSGDISASGKAGQASITVAGNGDFKAGGLEIGNATVSVIGSGDVTARATQNADVTVMGSGDVTLSGSAKCNVHKMGSGDVHCGT
ncbi:MAG TPA: head GIN domain-containing protein [Allosphingosinicella sp.]|nr:head GIN domain-containing protein [Allosphingosinicella sp.]